MPTPGPRSWPTMRGFAGCPDAKASSRVTIRYTPLSTMSAASFVARTDLKELQKRISAHGFDCLERHGPLYAVADGVGYPHQIIENSGGRFGDGRPGQIEADAVGRLDPDRTSAV